MKANVNRIRSYLGESHDGLEFVHPTTQNGGSNDVQHGDKLEVVQKDGGVEDAELESKLADILNDYLEQLENGTPTSVEQLVATYPQYEEPLREYLEGLNLLNAGIAEMSDSPFRFDEDGPQKLGDYELIREIGRGGMGVVYEARQISLGRRVALKVLPFAAMLDQRQIARFDTEARAAAGLQHPHIVPVYGVGCDRGVHYYAMQFIKGSSIREWIDAAKASNADVVPREAARLGVQAANALQTAHTCGVVHRDIKPSNLLLDAKNDLWIADFGLARSQSDNNITRSGDILGTLHYMSPEQTRGNSSIADPRSDIYSLGVTLYELLTLRRPFQGESHSEVLQSIELGHSKSISSFNSDVPRDLENVVAKAMSFDPSHRYQSAAEMEADLTRFMDGRATLAKPPSPLQRLLCWGARNRTVVASLFAVLCVAIIALACSTFWLAGERAELAEKRQVADEKLQVTETTLETFGMATAERLKQIPGSRSARKALLADLLTHYENLLSVSDNDTSMRADRAITRTKVANIHREAGEPQRALPAYRDAESDFRAILENETVAENQNHAAELLAKCQSNMSVVLVELGEVAKAAEWVRRAIELQADLYAKLPSTTHAMDLAASYANLASIEAKQGGTGIVQLKQAVELAVLARQQCSQEEQTNVLSSLSTIYGRLSTQLRKSNVTDATAYAEQAVECSQRLVSHHNTTKQSEIRQLHALNCNNLASMVLEQKETASAIELYKQAAKQLDAIETSDGLVRTLVNLAKAQTYANESVSAADTYGKAIAVQASLLRESPGNLNHVSRLGGLHNNRALAMQKLGKDEHAYLAYEAAVKYQERAYQLAPKHLVYYRDALSRTCFNAGKAFLNAGKPHQAAELQWRRAELWHGDGTQLFSVARNIAAAVDQMPANDTLRHEWAGKAREVLDAAIRHDASNLLDEDNVSKLNAYLSRNERRQR